MDIADVVMLAEDRHAEMLERKTRHAAMAREEARAEALRDTDTLADWMSGCCYLAKASAFQPVQRDKTAVDYLHWSTPDLIALLFDQGQPAQVTRAVRDVLADRFTGGDAVSKWIDARATELAVEMAIDEREAA